MASGVRLSAPGHAWLALAALLGAGSLLAWFQPANRWDWQPDLAFSEPWRAFTAAFVHWSPQHLGLNLGAAAVVAAFGHASRVPARAALAWLLAWPLTHLGLLLEPSLRHYGGLSGVLHAGVAIAVMHGMRNEQGRRRRIAAMVFVGMVVKLLLEAPWGPPARLVSGWDIAVAPVAHTTGAIAGIALALLLPRAARAAR